jgi:hypothetical protein
MLSTDILPAECHPHIPVLHSLHCRVWYIMSRANRVYARSWSRYRNLMQFKPVRLVNLGDPRDLLDIDKGHVCPLDRGHHCDAEEAPRIGLQLGNVRRPRNLATSFVTHLGSIVFTSLRAL